MNTIAETITKMIEALPEHFQKKLLDDITPLISEALDDARWEEQFQRENEKLAKIGEHVKDQILAGKSTPMDFSKL